MHQFFRRNSKKLLAIFGVFLMISFVATARMPTAGDRTAVLVGMFGDEKLMSSEVEAAKSEYRLLFETLMYQDQRGQWQQLMSAIPSLGEEPKLFALLQREARQMGITPVTQNVDQMLSQFVGAQVAYRSVSGTVVPLSDLSATDDSDRVQQVQVASEHLLLVLMGLNRALDVNKISRPLRDLILAQEHQSVQVKFVAFDAKKRESTLPAPTTRQLQEQFNRYADIPSTGTSTGSDAFGFGYQEPERFKLESIAIPHAAVAAAVQKSKSDYDWEVAAHYYYDKHLAEFATTQPATAPATLPDAISAPTSQPTSRPTATTKPFDAVKSQVMSAVMKPQVDELAEKAQRECVSILAADWARERAAPTSTASTQSAGVPTSSMSSLGVSYDGEKYLAALAAKIQSDLNVLPVVQGINHAVSVDDAPHVPEIGAAHSADGSVTFVDALIDPALLPLQPSVQLSDDAGNAFVFRIRERIAAHRPASLDVVKSAVESDWKRSEAFDLCKKDAARLQEAAKASDLKTAANAASLQTESTASFSLAEPRGPEPIAGLPLTGSSVDAFRKSCRTLLGDAALKKPAVATIESPLDGKVIVTELSAVTPDWPEGLRSLAEARVAVQLRRTLSQAVEGRWFNFDSVVQRTGFKDIEKTPNPS